MCCRRQEHAHEQPASRDRAGGRYIYAAAAISHARKLRAEDADIVELGPAASHSDSAPVSAAEERRRLAPVLGQLAADGIPVSVESFLTETLRFAVSAGVACLNDIHGFGDPGLYPLLATSECRLIVMHAVQAAGAATRVVTDASAVRDGIRRTALLVSRCEPGDEGGGERVGIFAAFFSDLRGAEPLVGQVEVTEDIGQQPGSLCG